ERAPPDLQRDLALRAGRLVPTRDCVSGRGGGTARGGPGGGRGGGGARPAKAGRADFLGRGQKNGGALKGRKQPGGGGRGVAGGGRVGGGGGDSESGARVG